MKRIAVLPGDGIGPEVTSAALSVLLRAAEDAGIEIECEEYAFGAAAYRAHGSPFPPRTRDAVLAADAVLLGAVGDPAFDALPRHEKPEAGLLALRKTLGVYANLRPVTVHPALADVAPLRPELLQDVDLLIVRELTGGLYFGEPRGRTAVAAHNTMRYSRAEVERVAHVAFRAAAGRRGKVTSVDKANVLEVSQLWREVVVDVATHYPTVALEHLYVDFAAMRLISAPASFDVLLTENLFGDILSDEAGVLVGSLGMLPSASLGDGPALYEPIHGSAPDIMGRGIANPVGAILSAALLLRHSLHSEAAAASIERAVATVLNGGGMRTADLHPSGNPVGSRAFTDAVLAALD